MESHHWKGSGRMGTGADIDMAEIHQLVEESAACSALLAATLSKLGAALQAAGAVEALEDPQHQRPQRLESFR